MISTEESKTSLNDTKEIKNSNNEPASADDINEKASDQKKFSVRDFLQVLLLIAMIGIIIYIRQIPLFSVDGHSMDRTYSDKDLLVGTKNAEITTGDILIIYSDILEERIVKRCIGLPGDTVKIKDNIVYVNNRKLDENYINEPMETDNMSITLSDGEYFVMGDNRNHSTDSRELGAIPEEKIIARVTHNLTKEYKITYKHLKYFKRIVIILAGGYILISLSVSFILPLFTKKK